jgi:predicted nuclease with TOPRIM domain
MASSTEQEKLDASLGKIIREVVFQGKNLSILGGLVASLGLGVYSNLSPEKEARAAYDTLRPVVQKNMNDLALLQAQLEALSIQQREVRLLLERLLNSQHALEERFSPKKQKAEVEQKYTDLVKGIEKMSRLEAFAPAPSRAALPEQPWEKESE